MVSERFRRSLFPFVIVLVLSRDVCLFHDGFMVLRTSPNARVFEQSLFHFSSLYARAGNSTILWIVNVPETSREQCANNADRRWILHFGAKPPDTKLFVNEESLPL